MKLKHKILIGIGTLAVLGIGYGTYRYCRYQRLKHEYENIARETRAHWYVQCLKTFKYRNAFCDCSAEYITPSIIAHQVGVMSEVRLKEAVDKAYFKCEYLYNK